ncbi:MAG: hypothetical protein WCP96_17370 [Methylococcaceae bacterium]
MQLAQYSDLTLAASLGGKRDKKYLQRFSDGKAEWYHMPLVTTENKSIPRHVIREVRYCAIAIQDNKSGKTIKYLYEVKSVRLIKRCKMTVEQAGKLDLGNAEEYWLFELGYARLLLQALSISGTRPFRFQLTNAKELLVAKNWDDLPKRYTMVI